MSVVDDEGNVNLLGRGPRGGSQPPPPLPRSLEELKAQDRGGPKQCAACRDERATHAVSVIFAKIEQQRGRAEYQLTRVPVCEPCGAQVVGLAKRALKQ